MPLSLFRIKNISYHFALTLILGSGQFTTLLALNIAPFCKMQKNVYVLIHLTAFINFCSQIFYEFHKLFPRVKAQKANMIWPKNVTVNPTSHFCVKIFKTFHEILCSRIFPCLILPSTQGHYLNNLGRAPVPNTTYQISRQSRLERRRIVMVTMLIL